MQRPFIGESLILMDCNHQFVGALDGTCSNWLQAWTFNPVTSVIELSFSTDMTYNSMYVKNEVQCFQLQRMLSISVLRLDGRWQLHHVRIVAVLSMLHGVRP